jgi:hypothetical protein
VFGSYHFAPARLRVDDDPAYETICQAKQPKICTGYEAAIRSLTRNDDRYSSRTSDRNAKTVQRVVEGVNESNFMLPKIRAKLPGARKRARFHEGGDLQAKNRDAIETQLFGSDAFSETTHVNFETGSVQRACDFG